MRRVVCCLAALALLNYAVVFGQSDPAIRSSWQIPNADLFLIAVDSSSGDVVVAGRTNENFIVTTGAYQRLLRGGNDVVVAKIRPTDGQVVASTLLGGGGEDLPTALVVDRAGNVYIAGTTSSRNFPTPETAFKRTTASASTSFVARLNSSLTALDFSTYVGGRGTDRISAMALDSNGFVYVAGTTESSDFPFVEPAFQRTHSPGSVFVTKLNGSGTGLVASTFLGQGSVANIGIDLQGNVTITGTTSSDRFPTTPDAVQPRKPASPFTHSDGFVTRMPPSLNALLYSTYFGGSQNDVVVDSEIDADGSVYVTGTSFSRDFPLTNTDASIGTSGTVFVAKFSLPRVVYARALRGNNSTTALGIDLGPDGGVNVIGLSAGTHFPTTSLAYRRCPPSPLSGRPVPFYARLNREGGFLYSTLLESALYESRHLTASTGGELLLLSFLPTPQGGPFVLTSLPVNVVQRLDFTASAPPRVDCVVNASTYAPSNVSPGLVVTIFGSGLGPAAAVGGSIEAGRVTTTAGGVRVLFDGEAAPILYASQDQVNAIVPFSVAGRGTTRMSVEYTGAVVGPVILPVRSALPGIFRLGATEQAVILNEDGTVNTPDQPAARGSIVTFWITGFGQYEAAATDGAITSDLSNVRLPVTLSFQDQRAELLYSGSAPGMVAGVAQVNARVPASAPASLRVPVNLTAGSETSQSSAYISLK
jgi:uncharacterized protein (TIGR03437 family)